MNQRRLSALLVAAICATAGTAQTRRPRHQPAGRAAAAPVGLVNQMARDDRDVGECVNNGSADTIARALSAKPFGLSATDRSVVIVDLFQVPNVENCMLCGARRCNSWIYRKNGAGYQSLLKVESADGVLPLRTSTNGYRDIRVSYAASVSGDVFSEIYKYEGRRYRKVQ